MADLEMSDVVGNGRELPGRGSIVYVNGKRDSSLDYKNAGQIVVELRARRLRKETRRARMEADIEEREEALRKGRGP